MLQSFLIKLLKSLTLDLVAWATRAVTDWIARRKRVKKTQDAAKEVENAKNPNDVRDSADNLP